MLGRNQPDDVKLIQLALSKVRQPGIGPYWPGRIDGKNTPEFEAAILKFQKTQSMTVNGRIGPHCPSNTRLESRLGQNFKNLGAAESKAEPGQRKRHHPNKPLLRDQNLKKIILPINLRDDLTSYRGVADREIGVIISYAKITTDPSGTLRFELDFDPAPTQEEERQLHLLVGRFPSIRIIKNTPLTLATVRPVRLRQGTLRPGPAGQRMFTGKLGKGGGAVHDIAALQAALANIDKPIGGTFWSNPINGKMSPSLQRAPNEFQIAADIKPSGGIAPGSPTETALIAALPEDRFGGFMG
jgi:peptidoglycan hydrolase-like protein with peptidoglycan-binding domain